MTKLKLDKEFGGGVLHAFGIAFVYCMRYYIPLCLDSKFRNAIQDAAKLIRQVTVSNGISRGISKCISRDISRGISGGISRGISEGISRGISGWNSRGISKDIMIVTGRADICVVLNGKINDINKTVTDLKKVNEIVSTETLIEVEVDLGW